MLLQIIAKKTVWLALTIIKSSMYTLSELSNTIVYVCYKNDIKLYRLYTMSITEVSTNIISK